MRVNMTANRMVAKSTKVMCEEILQIYTVAGV